MEHIYSPEATTQSTQSSSSSAYDFVKGFITGQLALLALLVLMVRLLFFRSVGAVITSPTTVALDSRIFNAKEVKRVKKLSNSLNDSVLLERLFDLNAQVMKGEASKQGTPEVLISDESARWLTFLLAKVVIDPLREQINSAELSLLLEQRLKEKLTNTSKYATLDALNFKVLSLGTSSYPQIDAYQLIYDTQQEACAFRVRCCWQDVFKVEVESALRLGGLVCLPFGLGVELKTARFTAQLQFPTGRADEVQLFCLPDDAFLLELEIGSLVGHRTKLKDLPKITAGIVEGLKKVLTETLIYPRSIKIPLLGEKLKGLLERRDTVNDDEDERVVYDEDERVVYEDESSIRNEVESIIHDETLDTIDTMNGSFTLTDESAPLLTQGQSYSSVASLVVE